MSQYPQSLPFGQSPDLSPLRESFAPRIGGPITDLNQQELQQNKQIGQERLMNQANQLQNAHAMQVAKGQTSTSTSGMGTSPITQSVMKAKQLATSMLDQDNLSDQQKGILRDLTNDPNVDYKTHLQAIDQLRTSQQEQLHQGNFEQRQSGMQSRQQQNLANQKQRMGMQQGMQQERQVNSQMKELQNQMSKIGASPDTPTSDKGIQGMQAQYKALEAQSEGFKQQNDKALAEFGNLPAGGDGSEQEQHGAEFGGGNSQAMNQAGYQPGTASIKRNDGNTATRSNGQTNMGQIKEDQWQKVLDENGGDVDKARAAAESQGFSFAGGGQKQQGRGKINAQDAQQYIHKAGGNKDAARAMAKQDGWSF